MTSEYLLTKISEWIDTDIPFKTYLFNYGYDNIRSYLNEVIEQGSDNSELNSTIFKYGNAPANYAVSNTLSGPSEYQSYFPGDFDGDGVTDLLITKDYYNDYGEKYQAAYSIVSNKNENQLTYLIQNKYLPGGSEITNRLVPTTLFASDYDADGRDDILYYSTVDFAGANGLTNTTFSKLTIQFSRNNNNLYYSDSIVQYAPSIAGSSYKYTGYIQNMFIPGDFDGDGKQDYILLLTKDDYLHKEYKAFFSCPGNNQYNIEISNFGVGTNTGDFFASTVSDAQKITAVNYDGDGADELLVEKPDGTVWIINVKRNGTTLSATSNQISIPSFNKAYIYTGDFNGDKITDLLARSTSGNNWNIYFGMGSGYSSFAFNWNHTLTFAQSQNDDHIIIGDFNGDGKSDIMDAYSPSDNDTKFNIYYSKGFNASSGMSSFNNAVYSYTNNNYEFLFFPGDFNGDGKMDLLNYNALTSFRYFYFNQDGKETMLEKIADGFNYTTEFTYDQLADRDGSTYQRTIDFTDTENQYPFNCIQQPLYVVSEVATPDGIGGITSINYNYTNAIIHRAGKGFLGFEGVYMINWNNHVKTTHVENDLNAQYALLTPNMSSTYFAPNHVDVSSTQTFTSFENLGTGNQKRYAVHIDRVLSTDYVNQRAIESSNSYDDYGNITINTTKTGSINNVSANPVLTTVTNTSYGIHNTPVPAKPENVTVTQTRNSNPSLSNTTTFTYNLLGQVQTQTTFSGLPRAVTTTYTYDGFGNVATIVLISNGELNRGTKFTYDNTGRFVVKKELTGATNNTLQKETYTINTTWGLPASVTSSDCLTSSFQYDGYGRLMKTTVPQGWDINYSYNWDISSGNIYYQLTSDPYNPDTKTWHDLLGRETKTQVQGFGGRWINQLTTYDDLGRLLTSTNQYYNTETALTTIEDYDDFDRIIESSNTLGTTDFDYSSDANGVLTTTVTHADGNITSNTTDAAGVTTSSTDNGGTLYFYYDSHGNETQVKQGSKVLVTSTYYGRDLQASMDDIDGPAMTYDYDAWGNLISQSDGQNNYSMQYDELNRITQRTGPEGTTTYQYYKDANTGCANNNVVNIIGFNGVNKSFTYDVYQRLQTETTTIDGTDYTTQYAYNMASRVNKITYPSGVVINKTYDVYGNEKTTSLGGTVLFTANNMNGSGEYIDYTLGNGKESQNTYYYGIPTHFYTSGVQDLNFYFDYTNGNLTKRADNIKSLNETFFYDNLNRITSFKINGTQQTALTYDDHSGQSYGNIISKGYAGNYTYNTQKIHQLKFVANATDNTSPPPNISTNEQDISYIVGFEKTQIINENGNHLAYIYGPDYNRVKSELDFNRVPVETKYYLGNYEKQIKDGITREIHYVAAGNGLCAIIVRQSGVNTVYYAYTDYLGSILTLTDASGSIVAEQSFDAWGRTRNPTTWKYSGVPAVPDWLYRGYTGHEQLPEFNLINMNGRIYNPIVSRMLSVDNYVSNPYNTQAYNRYAYALNNPLAYTDPDGNFIWFIPAIFAAVNLTSDLVQDNFKMNIGEIGESLLQGAVQGTFASLGPGAITTWQDALTSAIGSQLPSINFQEGNVSFSISPDIEFGTTGWRAGVNLSAEATLGNLELGIGLGEGYGRNAITGNTGSEFRISGLIGAHVGNTTLGLTTAAFYGGGISQRIGGAYFSSGDFSVQYENDWFWGLPNGDNGDRFRTTGARLSYKDIGLGLNLFTGDPGVSNRQTDIIDGVETYTGPHVNDYRAGILYASYGDYRIGVNGEPVRKFFQNHLAHHDGIGPHHFPIFPVLSTTLNPYLSYQSLNPFTTW